MRTVGRPPRARLAELAAITAEHGTLEDVMRWALALSNTAIPAVHAMDEYDLDVIVRLAEDLVLVYDTT